MEEIYWDYINPTIGVAIVFASVIEALIIYKIRNKMSTSMVYILNLAISDLLVGVMILVTKGLLIIITQMGARVRDHLWLIEIYAVVNFAFLRLSLVTSLLNIIAIAIDRWIAVARPYFYRKLKSRHAVLICALIWLVALSVVAIYYTIVRSKIENNTIRHEYELLIFPLLTLPTLLGLIFSYLSILRFLRRSRQEFTNQNSDSDVDESMTNHVEREYKVLKLSIAIIGTFALCWIPLSVYGILRAVGVHSRDTQIATFAIALVNSLLNPIVYFHHQRHTVLKGLRRVRKCLCCCCAKNRTTSRTTTTGVTSPCCTDVEQMRIMQIQNNFDDNNNNCTPQEHMLNLQIGQPQRKAAHSF